MFLEVCVGGNPCQYLPFSMVVLKFLHYQPIVGGSKSVNFAILGIPYEWVFPITWGFGKNRIAFFP